MPEGTTLDVLAALAAVEELGRLRCATYEAEQLPRCFGCRNVISAHVQAWIYEDGETLLSHPNIRCWSGMVRRGVEDGLIEPFQGQR